MNPTAAARKVNWKHLPDAISEDQVKLKLNWSADQRTAAAIARQAELMGFESPSAYLVQSLAATLAGNEADTLLADDGRILNGGDGYDADGLPQNV